MCACLSIVILVSVQSRETVVIARTVCEHPPKLGLMRNLKKSEAQQVEILTIPSEKIVILS